MKANTAMFIVMLLWAIFSWVMLIIYLRDVRRKMRCKTEIMGTFLHLKTYSSRRRTYCTGVFCYEFGGMKFERTESLDDFLYNKKVMPFSEGQRYPIYVDAKHPKRFRCMKRVLSVSDVVTLVVMGILVVFSGMAPIVWIIQFVS